jgi:hypothetical protein
LASLAFPNRITTMAFIKRDLEISPLLSAHGTVFFDAPIGG